MSQHSENKFYDNFFKKIVKNTKIIFSKINIKNLKFKIKNSTIRNKNIKTINRK